MYEIQLDSKYEFDLPIEKIDFRLDELIGDTRKVVVYLKNEFDNSTFRYRYFNFNEALEKSQKYKILCFLTSEIEYLFPYLSKISLIIFQRATWNFKINNLIQLAKLKRIKIVYDIDDLIYKQKYIPQYLNNSGIEDTTANVRHFLGEAGSMDLIAEQCDAFICTTPFLKRKLENDFNKSTYVISNFYNKEQFDISKIIEIERKFNSEKFWIGYFSGSASHINDFSVCKDEIEKFLFMHENAALKIVGYMELDENWKMLEEQGKLFYKPFCPYQELQYEIAEVDVNIAPLSDNEFNCSKSELKFFEAAIVNTPSIVSNVGIYKNIINNSNGMLCNKGEWNKALEKMYNNVELRNSISKNAYNYAVNNYDFRNFGEKIEKVYDSIID